MTEIKNSVILEKVFKQAKENIWSQGISRRNEKNRINKLISSKINLSIKIFVNISYKLLYIH